MCLVINLNITIMKRKALFSIIFSTTLLLYLKSMVYNERLAAPSGQLESFESTIK